MRAVPLLALLAACDPSADLVIPPPLFDSAMENEDGNDTGFEVGTVFVDYSFPDGLTCADARVASIEVVAPGGVDVNWPCDDTQIRLTSVRTGTATIELTAGEYAGSAEAWVQHDETATVSVELSP